MPDSIAILIVHDLKLSSGWRRLSPRHWKFGIPFRRPSNYAST